MLSNDRPKAFANSDHFMKSLWFCMARDFRSVLGPQFCQKEEITLRHGVKDYRNLDWGRRFLSPYFFFKAEYQMESLFKRYRFADDLYSDEELDKKAINSFIETQKRIETHIIPNTTRVNMVINKASQIAANILGDYSSDEHIKACRFGKRASVGCPASQSYLDWKIGCPTTGSREHLAWFNKEVLPNDTLLADAFTGCVPMSTYRDEPVAALALTLVPKSFKSRRVIMPNTLIGGFYTYGLGKVIQSRLTGVGLNIRYLQRKHQRLTVLFSKTRTHVTADLSAASDSFTVELVRRLVPKAWFDALNLGRVDSFTLPGSAERSKLISFMTMGLGYTFPLQTLLFYCIVSAVKDLLGSSGFVSVYGDDLIYPTRIHSYVRTILEELGFLLNDDKTFVKESFRESCGADSYCGFDVRPFQPEGSAQDLHKEDYLMLCYKTLNGLLARWSEFELPVTYRWLILEILRCTDHVHQVPHSFPDYSGIKVDFPFDSFKTTIPWAPVKYSKQGTLLFEYLGLSYGKRAVVWQIPFYWNKLRQLDSEIDGFNPFENREDSEELRWIKVKTKPWRSSVSRCRFNYRLVAKVTKKRSKCQILRQQGNTCVWS